MVLSRRWFRWSHLVGLIGACFSVACSSGEEEGGLGLGEGELVLDERYAEASLIDDLIEPSAVRETQDVDGQIVYCVDVDRQPGLLDRKTRQYRPLRSPPSIRAEVGLDTNEQVAYPGAANCPLGTVPIPRVTQEQLARFDSVGDFFRKYPKFGQESVSPADKEDSGTRGPIIIIPWHTGPTDQHQYAVVTRNVTNWGAGAVINVWNPAVELNSEFSLLQIWAAGGSKDDNSLQTVEAGVQKYPQMYGDSSPRIFIYSTRDNYKNWTNPGCYNNSCGDFVQISTTHYPGMKISYFSISGGNQRVYEMLWLKDNDNGAWWLRIYGDWVGYYDRPLFSQAGIQNRASRFDFGGAIIDNVSNGHTMADMGSGAFPSAGAGYAAYMRTLEYVWKNGGTAYLVAAAGMSTELTDAGCYDESYQHRARPLNTTIFVGGPGYDLFNCR